MRLIRMFLDHGDKVAGGLSWAHAGLIGGSMVAAIVALFAALLSAGKAKDRAISSVVKEKNKEIDKKTVLIADKDKALADLHTEMGRQIEDLQKNILARVDREIEYYKNRGGG